MWDLRQDGRKNSRRSFIKTTSKTTIEVIYKYRLKLLYLRVKPHKKMSGKWEAIQIIRNRFTLKRPLMSCPYCCGAVDHLWNTGLNRGDWRCHNCIELPSAHRSTAAINRFRKAIRHDQLETIMSALQTGGMVALDARLAMEIEGLTPRKMYVENMTISNQIKNAKPITRYSAAQRLKCRISRGRLLYVQGKIYVR